MTAIDLIRQYHSSPGYVVRQRLASSSYRPLADRLKRAPRLKSSLDQSAG